MLELQHWAEFLPKIKQLPRDRPLERTDLLTDAFLMEREDGLDMYYAPHNEYINTQARVVIAGITPGFQQMKKAFEQVILCLESEKDDPPVTLKQQSAILMKAKQAARFAGSMRQNLISMLDSCELPQALKLSSSAELFESDHPLLHTTSVIKYPVFAHGKNYTGHHPKISHSKMLMNYATHVFPTELQHLPKGALVIPLGKMVEELLTHLHKENVLPEHTYVFGLPHPSGANGHRKKQFFEQRQYLRHAIRTWAEG